MEVEVNFVLFDKLKKGWTATAWRRRLPSSANAKIRIRRSRITRQTSTHLN